MMTLEVHHRLQVLRKTEEMQNYADPALKKKKGDSRRYLGDR